MMIVFDKTLYFGRYPSSDSTDTEGENRPIRWMLEKRQLPVYKIGKEKFIESESIRKLYTRSDLKKMLADAMKAKAKSTARNQRKRTFRVSEFQMTSSDVVEVSKGEYDGGPAKNDS